MDTSALHKISCGLYVIGAKNGESFGGSIVDALIQATSCKPPHIIFCSMNKNYTTGLIRETGFFSVSVLSTQVNPFVIANFGFQSGKDTDKWANVDYDKENGLPFLKNAAAYFSCAVEDIRITPTHNIITATVDNSWMGTGEPLLYGDYHKSLKNSVALAFKDFKATGQSPFHTESPVKITTEPGGKTEKWVCTLCGYVYDESTPFEQLPDDWTCPLCGAGKELFEKQWL